MHKAGDLNILLKSAMKYSVLIFNSSTRKLPFLGPNLVKAGFLLLERNWEKDSTNIDHYMADLIHNNDNKWLLIFPEGTTRHACMRKNVSEISSDRPQISGIRQENGKTCPGSIESLSSFIL